MKKYKLIKTLLMPGMLSILLPIGYEVTLKGDRYIGEGGWYFAPHGVEDNKYHWEEIKDIGIESLTTTDFFLIKDGLVRMNEIELVEKIVRIEKAILGRYFKNCFNDNLPNQNNIPN